MSSAYNSRQIVKSFPAREFIPSLLSANPHWQTIIGSEALRQKIFGYYPRTFATTTERIHTDDDDFFDVDFTSNCAADEDTPMVIVLHGLESNTAGPLVTKMVSSFLEKGFCCCLVSFRGCSGEDNLTPGGYHLGWTADLDYLIKRVISTKYPKKNLYLSGFSLGGNVVLKYLGELGESAKDLHVCGAAVTCVPFDPVASQSKLDQGFNRAVYSMVMLYYMLSFARVSYNHICNILLEFLKDIESES
jgi:predicted alpha/beta-fold hydrolase